jgi:hypothetical protein
MERAPDGLFDFVSRRSPARIAVSRCLNWLLQSKDRLAPFVALSIALHLTVFGLLAVTHGTSPETQAKAQDRSSGKAVRKAVEALRLDVPESAALSEALAKLDEDSYEDILERAPELDPRLGEREQTEIFRSLMKRSLDRLGTKTGDLSALDFPAWELLPGSDVPERIRLADGDIILRLGANRDGRPKLYRLPAMAAKRLESLRSAGDQEEGSREVLGGKVEVRTERGFARVPEEYYFRECPFEQMIALGGSVFYAISGFPRLETPDDRNSISEASGRTPSIPTLRSQRGTADNAVTFIYLPSVGSREEPVPETAPMALPELSEQNVGAILDGLMELSDEDQVGTFMRTYLSRNDPDDPLLARLTQRFLYENLGGVFNLGDRLATAFDFLEELFFNKLFQNKLVDYGLQHRNSRTGTEILLCLAALYDFERRGLSYLEDSLDEIEAVQDNRPGRADVFNKGAKAFVLEAVYRDLVSGIRSRGLDDLDSVLREYRDEQARIYGILIAIGGEAGNRARYALGCLYWDEGQEARALKEWKAIDSAYTTPVLTQLRWIMSLTYGQELLWSRISSVFLEESKKNSAAALDRLTKFHLWEKRSAKLRAEAVD